MEFEKLYKLFPHIDRHIIKELFRTFKNYISDKNGVLPDEQSSKYDFNKTNLAIAFCNLLAYEPDSITNFHYKQMEIFFSKPELLELYELYEIILNKKMGRYSSVNVY